MTNLLKSKPSDIIYKFNDTFRYLDDMFLHHWRPWIDKHIHDIERQLNKADSSDKVVSSDEESSFFDLNI